MEFSEKIKNARLAAGISQRELAEKTGLSKRTIQNYEMGARIPKSRDTYEILAKALGIKEEVLLDDNAEFILQANAIYGPRGAKQAWDMVHELKAVFAGGELADEDLDSIMRAVQDAYWDAKEENRKYIPKKYRKDQEDV